VNIFSNGTEMKYAVSCPRCSWKMEAAPFVPVVGGATDPRLLRYIGKLKEHVEQKHPDVAMQIGAFSAFLIAAAFKLEDPLLLKMHFDLRYALHRMTRAKLITDEEIQDRVSRIEELDRRQQEAVSFLLRDMRDVLTEQGEYAPKQPSVSPVTA
jgi:hypothetical protein